MAKSLEEQLANILKAKAEEYMRRYTIETKEYYVQQMMSIIEECISEVHLPFNATPSVTDEEILPLSKSWTGESMITTGFKITISFPVISKPSWYPTNYPDGVYDLVGLFNQGYSAKNYVYDPETGAKSKKYRPSLRFIQTAVQKFNAITPPNINATCGADLL